MKIRLLLLLLFVISSLYAKSYEIEFKWNQKLQKAELFKALGLEEVPFYEFYKKAPSLDENAIPLTTDTLENFYKSYGFYHVKIEAAIQKDKVIFRIKEGNPVRVEQIIVDSLLDINRSIPFVLGDIFDAHKFIQSKKAIQKKYEKNGYCNAKYNTKAYIDIVKNSVKLLYRVKPDAVCRFNNIVIKNPKNIDKKIIVSLVEIKKGELYTPETIDKSYKNLYAYDGISEVLITPAKNNTPDVNVSIDVKSNPKPIEFQVGAGVSTDQGVSVKLGIKHRNFFGNLKTLSFNVKATKIRQSVGVDFTMPLPHSNIFGSQIKFKNEDFFSFKEQNSLINSFLRQRRDKNSFQETLMIDTARTYESNDLILFPRTTLNIISPILEWDYDTRDNILNPSKGFFINTSFQGSLQSEISDASYYKVTLKAGYILSLNPTILAFKIDTGYLNILHGSVPASYRFFAGGMYSNRAYRYRRLGPIDKNGDPAGFNFLTETTVEYRFGIYRALHGVVFNDNSFIGDGYGHGDTTGYYSGGVGLRYETPIGPLGIDYGFDLNNPQSQYAFHFHVGESF
jgi:translocation and assembly module TamA